MARRVAGLARLAGTAALLLLAAPAAQAVTGSPPVTAPDRVAVAAGEGSFVDVLANDSDPDGDQLAVCRLGPLPRALQQSGIQGGQLVLVANPHSHGHYTFTYYACDTSSLTPGTVTVKIRPPRPTLEVIPIDGQLPGRLRIVNTFKKGFHCSWHPTGTDKVEGKVFIPATSSVVIRVHEKEVDIECQAPHVGYSISFSAFRHEVRRTR